MSSTLEAQRLQNYFPFDDAVVETIAEVADQHRLETFSSINDRLPANEIFVPQYGSPVEVFDSIPKGANGQNGDYEQILVYNLSMGNRLNPNMRVVLSVLRDSLPTTRLIAFSNPSAPGFNYGKIKPFDLLSLANNKVTLKENGDLSWADLIFAANGSLEYLEAQDEIEDGIVEAGYSFGAEKAALSSAYADKYDLQVAKAILMEPVSVKNRWLLGLTWDFITTGKALDGYIAAADSDASREARRLAAEESHGMTGYAAGIFRLSNIAIGHALARGSFEKRIGTALERQAEMEARIFWGSASELSIDDLMLGVTSRLIDQFGSQRVVASRLQGQKHAMGDDIFLHAAMVLQGLSDNATYRGHTNLS